MRQMLILSLFRGQNTERSRNILQVVDQRVIMLECEFDWSLQSFSCDQRFNNCSVLEDVGMLQDEVHVRTLQPLYLLLFLIHEGQIMTKEISSATDICCKIRAQLLTLKFLRICVDYLTYPSPPPPTCLWVGIICQIVYYNLNKWGVENDQSTQSSHKSKQYLIYCPQGKQLCQVKHFQ